jgi:hypothetical protein
VNCWRSTEPASGRSTAGTATTSAGSLRDLIRAADERSNDYLERRGRSYAEDGATHGGAHTKNLAEKIAALQDKRGRYEVMIRHLERTGGDQISLTDPDTPAMAAHTKVGVGNNVQVAVDAKHKIIVEQAVTILGVEAMTAAVAV